MSEAPPHPALAEDLLPFDDAGRRAMEAAAGHAIACRLSLAEGLAKPALRPAELASRFDHLLADAGEDAVSVIDTLVRDAGDGVHPHTSLRFFGYVCGGSMPVGAAADMLDANHHALHALIDGFAKGANAVLGEPNGVRQREAVCRFLTDLTDFDRLLVRHLTDEEDLVLPVVLKHRVG